MTRNKTLTFSENFTLTGIAACLSKTTAAPIERVKDKVLRIFNPQEPVAPFIADSVVEHIHFSDVRVGTAYFLLKFLGILQIRSE